MKKDVMLDFWKKLAISYGSANDLEEKQRNLLSAFLSDKTGKVLELACGNGKVLGKIQSRNPSLKLIGMDYSKEMIEEAQNNSNGIEFIQGDIREVFTLFKSEEFDTVFSLNSLHNLPDLESIELVFEAMGKLVKPGGYVIFDIRNSFNPFINYGYRKNRKNGLQFHTLNSYHVISKFFPDKNFELIKKIGIFYQSINEAGMGNRSKIYKLIYSIYLFTTRIYLFSPYQFIILKRK